MIDPVGPALPPSPPPPRPQPARGLVANLGTGIVTGAADDDPSAIGTYASAGAKFGFTFLWIAPVLLPMMFVVTYVAAKLGRVYGKGLFAALRDRFPRTVVIPLMLFAFAGNMIEAAANLGGIGAAAALFVPLPIPLIVASAAALILGFQIFGSYDLLRRIFCWLALTLLAYVVAALLAKPDPADVLRATFVPELPAGRDAIAMIVACIGTSLSAYVYTWQSNQEVEEQIDDGRRHVWQRRGASASELARTRSDVLVGMIFSNVILYFIILSTAATLHRDGTTTIDSAAQAASALEPLAGGGAKPLFALGVIGVGMLAVPVMTIGAAYDLVQGLRLPGGLHAKLTEARCFYGIIVAVTIASVGLNLLGFNPMRALVWSGIVQGFSVPPLLGLMMIMTGDKSMMGEHANSPAVRLLGWATVAVTGGATVALAATWII
jgi:NRAMP (natural resistance-associated macrophage protein)-like metal ion transporter